MFNETIKFVKRISKSNNQVCGTTNYSSNLKCTSFERMQKTFYIVYKFSENFAILYKFMEISSSKKVSTKNKNSCTIIVIVNLL